MSNEETRYIVPLSDHSNDFQRRTHRPDCHRLDGNEYREATDDELETHRQCSQCAESGGIYELLTDESVTELDQVAAEVGDGELATDGGETA